MKTETIFFIDQTFHVWDKTINKEVSFSKKNLPNKHINSIVYVDTPHFNLIPSSIAENISNKEKADFISSNNQKKIIINQKINKTWFFLKLRSRSFMGKKANKWFIFFLNLANIQWDKTKKQQHSHTRLVFNNNFVQIKHDWTWPWTDIQSKLR